MKKIGGKKKNHKKNPFSKKGTKWLKSITADCSAMSVTLPICYGKNWQSLSVECSAVNLVFSSCVTEQLPKCTDSSMALQIGQCNGQNRINSVIIVLLYRLTEFLHGSRQC